MAVGNNISNVYTYRTGGKTYTVDPASQGGYMRAFDQYASDAANAKNLYEKQFNTDTSNLRKTLESNNATTNANYDNSARQAYVQYMQRQRALPSQLQALGVNGGATESGLLNLYNNYGSSHAANEQQRNADLTTNQQSYDDAYNNLVSARTQYLMDYEKDLAAQRQQAISNQINEYNNEITRFSSSVAQYPTTAGGYKKYEEWIKNMAASSDPLKDIKVALIRQQMATQFPDGNPDSGGGSGSGGGGGGSRRSYGGRRSGGGGGGDDSSSKKLNVTPSYTDRGGTVNRPNSVMAYASGKGKKTTVTRLNKNGSVASRRTVGKWWR